MKSLNLLPVFLALCVVSATAAESADETGFVSLFNGKDITGWDGDPAFWSVTEGAITGQTTPANPLKRNTFLIWTNGVTENFELRLSYKIPNGNSGVQYRSRIADQENRVVTGYQADFEAGRNYSGIIYEEGGRRFLARRGEKTIVRTDPANPSVPQVEVIGSSGDSNEIQASIKSNDWNEYVIIARGNHLIHKINGRITAECTDLDEPRAAKSGVLALQLHTGPPMLVQFKDIRIKTLE